MKKVLFVWFKKYNGILEGGGIANHRNFRMAQMIFGPENVDSEYIHDENKKRSFCNLVASAFYFPFGYYNGLIPNRVKEIVEKAKDYDYVFLNTSLFGILAKKLKEAGYKGEIIAHFHNVESVYYDNLLPKKMLFRNVIIKCADRNDGYSCEYANKIVSLNERDSSLLLKKYGRSADFMAPISFADKCRDIIFDTETLTRKRPLCFFIGSCFAANNEGVLWFVKNVLPYVDIEFKVVGKGMAKLKEENECMKDIEVVGDAPDLVSYFMEADFMILPIFSGSGMKVKTCEALMYGKNILGSSETFEGYELDYDKVGGCYNTADEYIKALKKYSESPVLRYNSYSRDVFLNKYSEEMSLKVFEKLFDRV